MLNGKVYKTFLLIKFLFYLWDWTTDAHGFKNPEDTVLEVFFQFLVGINDVVKSSWGSIITFWFFYVLYKFSWRRHILPPYLTPLSHPSLSPLSPLSHPSLTSPLLPFSCVLIGMELTKFCWRNCSLSLF